MNRNGLSNRLACRMDLQTELQPLQSLVEIYGNERVLIENYRGICEYINERITVAAKSGRICVCGRKLRIALMTKDRLVIQGHINSVAVGEGT